MDIKYTVLDHIDHIRVPGKVFEKPVNEYWALVYLWDGMEFLYRQAAQCDELIKQRVNPDGHIQVSISGNHPHLQGIPHGLLTSAFHWYAISACQYVRTVGAINYRQAHNQLKALDYLKRVIPEVLVFRDKVAAHFAWNTQHQEDNNAERLYSIMPQLTYIDDSFFVGGYTVSRVEGEKTSSSVKIQPWSVSKVHEQLRQRYWPQP